MISIGESISAALKKLFRDRVTFGDRSFVEYLNREAIRYVEGNRSLEIVWYFDGSQGRRGRKLSSSSLSTWDPPFNDIDVADSKKAEILEKIKIYCQKRKIPLRIADKRE